MRANADGSIVRMSDVGRIELGAQYYYRKGRFNGAEAAIIAIYQSPGSNAIDTVKRAKALMEEAKQRFPADVDYVTSLDTTLAVSEGIQEIVKTLFEALVLVIIVVFIFLQGLRATLIPLLAVPVSLVGTFAIFPLLGFSINTLSLFGLVLAIGLVVDDAIVVVEAVEHHIEEGLSPQDAAFKAMEQVSSPVIAIAIILTAVFVPTAFIPGITGRLYQQFAVTIAVSVDHLGLQRPHAEPGALRAAAEAQDGDPRPARRVLPLVQPRLRPRDRRLRRLVPPPDPQGGIVDGAPRGHRRAGRVLRLAAADELRARGGPGLLLHERAAPRGGVAAAHRRGREGRSRAS